MQTPEQLRRRKRSLSGSRIYNFQDQKLLLVVVGLPARGKLYTSKKIVSYLKWKGIKTRIFNIDEFIINSSRTSIRRNVSNDTPTETSKGNDNTDKEGFKTEYPTTDNVGRSSSEDDYSFLEKRMFEMLDEALYWLCDNTSTTRKGSDNHGNEKEGEREREGERGDVAVFLPPATSHENQIQIIERCLKYVPQSQAATLTSTTLSTPGGSSSLTNSNYSSSTNNFSHFINKKENSQVIKLTFDSYDTSTQDRIDTHQESPRGISKVTHGSGSLTSDVTISTPRSENSTNTTTNNNSNTTNNNANNSNNNILVLFVETICDDLSILTENYKRKIETLPQYKGLPQDVAIKKLQTSIINYQKMFESIKDDNIPYMKLVNLQSKVYQHTLRSLCEYTGDDVDEEDGFMNTRKGNRGSWKRGSNKIR
eukprot:TRINITY_DN824_c0_g1_i5.p1 TRINITY_DN824_c0_g1~~TRINITY_DN824_c0_g1_i5.p1  ORF type:complete len:423 (-),score=55.86 TRINITY_DN824_c0_g1_i5:832-2100(-)